MHFSFHTSLFQLHEKNGKPLNSPSIQRSRYTQDSTTLPSAGTVTLQQSDEPTDSVKASSEISLGGALVTLLEQQFNTHTFCLRYSHVPTLDCTEMSARVFEQLFWVNSVIQESAQIILFQMRCIMTPVLKAEGVKCANEIHATMKITQFSYQSRRAPLSPTLCLHTILYYIYQKRSRLFAR